MLAETKTKAGYNAIITRWERMCEFVSVYWFYFFVDMKLMLHTPAGLNLTSNTFGFGVPMVPYSAHKL
jgi:hypothetical protein